MKSYKTILTALATGAWLCCSGMLVHADNWPGWRGPHRNGLTTDDAAPLQWSPTTGVAWKVPVPGTGISNPIVWDDQVILTASEGRVQGELHIISLDRDTGKERWHQRLWGTAPTLFYYPKSGMASPSPVTDGKLLWVFFGTGDVFCLDLAGNLLWQRSLANEYGAFENRFAASSSPLLFEDMLILQCDHYGASYVLAIDQKTGVNRWKSDRPEVWLSWSSPQLMSVAGRMELVLSGSEKLDGYDPQSGSRLWTVKGLARECVPTPLIYQGNLISVSGPNGVHVAVKPGGTGDVTDSHVIWRNDKGTSFVPSGIVIRDHYYLVDDKGIGSCFDARTGDIVWRKRIGSRFTASPVAAGDRLYLTNENGSTLVLDASTSEYKEVARNELDEEVYSSAAISQGRLFIRGSKHLFCIR